MGSDAILCPTQPLFFVASQNHVRVYNLVKQQLVRKLLGSAGRITCLALHSSGDHVLAGAPRPCTSPALSVSAVPLLALDLHQRLPVQMSKAQAPDPEMLYSCWTCRRPGPSLASGQGGFHWQ